MKVQSSITRIEVKNKEATISLVRALQEKGFSVAVKDNCVYVFGAVSYGIITDVLELGISEVSHIERIDKEMGIAEEDTGIAKEIKGLNEGMLNNYIQASRSEEDVKILERTQRAIIGRRIEPLKTWTVEFPLFAMNGQHVVITSDGYDVKMYVNAVEVLSVKYVQGKEFFEYMKGMF